MSLLSFTREAGEARNPGQDSTARTPAAIDREMEEDLRRALLGELVPQFHFQPIGDLQGGVVAGYEALLRLPLRTPAPPDLCLQAAARLGFGVELETIVARQALKSRELLPANSFLSLNVSPGFLLSSAWEDLLNREPGLERVVVEITEEQHIVNYGHIRARVAAIRSRGGLIAIDDAGAGYASLKHILELRPSFIKLDRALVSGCDADRAKAVVIEMLGAAASRMDAWIIAEGVETEGELAELVRLGVPLAQGYYLGRPTAAMEALLPRAVEDLRTYASCRDAQANPLLLLAEVCPTATSVEKAEAILVKRPETPSVIITDGWGRPVELMERHPVAGLRRVPELLRCGVGSGLEEVLQRALTRPPAHRFDPVILHSSDGSFWGLARVDRLMIAVLPRSGASPARPG